MNELPGDILSLIWDQLSNEDYPKMRLLCARFHNFYHWRMKKKELAVSVNGVLPDGTRNGVHWPTPRMMLSFRCNVRHGLCVIYYPNGVRVRSTYHDGKCEGAMLCLGSSTSKRPRKPTHERESLTPSPLAKT